MSAIEKLKRTYHRLENIFSRRASYPKPIQKILLVGGLYDSRNRSRLCETDRAIMKDVFEVLKKAGISTNYEPEIQVVNLAYGDDFLEGDYDADLVILGNLYEKKRGDSYNKNERTLRSPLRTKPDVWFNAIKNSGAKIIIIEPSIEKTIDEINFDDVKGPGLIRLNFKGYRFDVVGWEGWSSPYPRP